MFFSSEKIPATFTLKDDSVRVFGNRRKPAVSTLIYYTSQSRQCDRLFLQSSELGLRHTANNYGLMYSRKRISQNSFPNFVHIIPKSFMVFCQELQYIIPKGIIKTRFEPRLPRMKNEKVVNITTWI